MADAATKMPKLDLSQNKANVMLRKAAEGKYGIPGVCVVSLPYFPLLPLHSTRAITLTTAIDTLKNAIHPLLFFSYSR